MEHEHVNHGPTGLASPTPDEQTAHEQTAGSAGHDHSAHEHAGHDHAGHDHSAHDPAAFKRKFWLSLLLTIPTVVFSHGSARHPRPRRTAFPREPVHPRGRSVWRSSSTAARCSCGAASRNCARNSRA